MRLYDNETGGKIQDSFSGAEPKPVRQSLRGSAETVRCQKPDGSIPLNATAAVDGCVLQALGQRQLLMHAAPSRAFVLLLSPLLLSPAIMPLANISRYYERGRGDTSERQGSTRLSFSFDSRERLPQAALIG
jgi:hypothetical protein